MDNPGLTDAKAVVQQMEVRDRRLAKKLGCVADLLYLTAILTGVAAGFSGSLWLLGLQWMIAGPLIVIGIILGIVILAKGAVWRGVSCLLAGLVAVPLLVFFASSIGLGFKAASEDLEEKRAAKEEAQAEEAGAREPPPSGLEDVVGGAEREPELIPPPPEPELRQWRSAEGEEIEGTFVGALKVDKVPTLEIESPEGKVLNVPIWRLAPEEVTYAHQFTDLAVPPLSDLEEWFSADGRKMSARLISVGTSGECVFVREGGGVFHVALDTLSPESQSKIATLKIE